MSDNYESRKLMAIMFTDIHGYSRMMQIDEKLTIEMLDEHNKLLFPIIQSCGGRIVKTVGDAILAVFDSCISSINAAVSIQERLSEKASNEPDKHILRVRIGIHLGETLLKDNDVFGNGVNIAARLQPLADPGGICFSQSVYEQVHNHYGERIVRVGPVNLKNISEPVVIYRMQIDGAVDNDSINDSDKQRMDFKTAFTEGIKSDKKSKSGDVYSKEISAFFGANSIKGHWCPGSRVGLRATFGDVRVNLDDAEFDTKKVVIKIDILCGMIKIKCSRDRFYINNETSSFFADINGINNKAYSEDMINITITGKAIMGEVKIVQS